MNEWILFFFHYHYSIQNSFIILKQIKKMILLPFFHPLFTVSKPSFLLILKKKDSTEWMVVMMFPLLIGSLDICEQMIDFFF